MIDERVIAAIEHELQYQKDKWGADKEQSLPGYMLVMQKELNEAIDGWMKNKIEDRQTCLEEIVQVVAVGIKCLETYGTCGSALSTNDYVAWHSEVK